MLNLSTSMRDAIFRQAHEQHPIECCGIITSLAGEPRPHRLIPMHNAAQSKDFFIFEPREQLLVWREMDVRSEFPLVIYHSHTASKPYPSSTDVDYAAAFPDAYHLIISTVKHFCPAMRCYYIKHGRILEQELTFEQPPLFY